MLRTDFAIALAFLMWFALVGMLWMYLTGRLDKQIELGIESINERWDDIPKDRAREKQKRPRNASHGRPRGRTA